ncbi:MAG: hypothetical protein OEQ74_11045, partial [Gammaproteobacteria bacterium]|nr:hypothetical protein [Gammaproteobacteria bacterium]
MTAPQAMSFSVAMFMLAVAIPARVSAESSNADTDNYDSDAALQHSQAAIGKSLGDYTLTDRDGNTIRLTDYAGKPL